MRKSLFLVMCAGAVFASCTSDDFVGTTETSQPEVAANAINFGGESHKVTRAATAGADAAELLNNQFRVFGTISKLNAGVEETTTVFDNYVVKYDGNVGGDKSNAFGWTYLGSNSLGASPVTQEVKYWDLAATRYDFVAFAGLTDDQKIVGTTENAFDVDATNAQSLFVSNRVVAKDRRDEGVVMYSDPVRFTFSRMSARVRVGFYETIPGYAVKNVRFYYDGNALSSALSTKAVAGLRGQIAEKGKYTVTYGEKGAPLANLAVDGATVSNHIVLGELGYTTAQSSAVDQVNQGFLDEFGALAATGDKVYLSTTSAQPTWALADVTLDGKPVTASDWQPILPYVKDITADNGRAHNLVLRVDFDLVPLDGTKAVINIYNAAAVVPAAWTQWKPNYAYTYIFKITDKIKGSTTPPSTDKPVVPDPNEDNPDPDTPAVTPIVFDAEVSAVEDFNQETITGVTALGGDAITTYSPDSNVTDAAEYKVGETITVSSFSHGCWRLAYSATVVTEKEVEDNKGAMYSWEILDGAVAPDNIDNKDGVTSAKFDATKAGYYIVQLHYLPDGRIDLAENYVDIYKVVKVHE